MRTLISVACVVIAVGLLLYGLFDTDLKSQERTEKRVKSLSKVSRLRTLESENQRRRKQLSDNLKAIENGRKPKTSLRDRLTQTGTSLSVTGYFMLSIGLGVVGFIIGVLLLQNVIYASCLGVLLGVGVPHWAVSMLIKKRLTKFSNDFPDVIDVIVRGVKSGLPLIECIKIVALESEEPIRSEIAHVMDEQNMGVSISDAFERMARNIPIQEVRFFAICIALQQKSGGSLAESLSNLSRVLRDRKKMKLKILAYSSEAKSSAMIIGCLPFALMFLLSIVAPDYIGLLFTTSTGNVALIGSAVWMSIGIFVMRQIINFDF
jgi:tight adherence protein B